MIVVLVLELALFGAVTLVLAALCSITRCVSIVDVAPDPSGARTVITAVTPDKQVTPAAGDARLVDAAAGVPRGSVPAGQMTEHAETRSLLTSPAAPMTGVAPSPAAFMTGARRSVTPQEEVLGGADDLPTVIANATNWLRGIATGLAILFATLAGVRWSFAREPGDVDRARSSLAAACAGFAIAVLAPQIMSIVREILGVSNG